MSHGLTVCRGASCGSWGSGPSTATKSRTSSTSSGPVRSCGSGGCFTPGHVRSRLLRHGCALRGLQRRCVPGGCRAALHEPCDDLSSFPCVRGRNTHILSGGSSICSRPGPNNSRGCPDMLGWRTRCVVDPATVELRPRTCDALSGVLRGSRPCEPDGCPLVGATFGWRCSVQPGLLRGCVSGGSHLRDGLGRGRMGSRCRPRMRFPRCRGGVGVDLGAAGSGLATRTGVMPHVNLPAKVGLVPHMFLPAKVGLAGLG